VGTVFKKSYTKPLPTGAEIFVRGGERFARWRRKGKTRTAPVTIGQNGSSRITVEANVYYGRYRDHAGTVVEQSTGCRDEAAARQVLARWEREVERIKAGVLTPAEEQTARHQGAPIARHFDAYRDHLQAAGVTEQHIKDTRHRLDRLAAECSFSTLGNLNRDAFVGWLAARQAEGMSARTRNAYRESIVAFCNRCIPARLATNPFSRIAKANQKADPRRRRRAMDEAELLRLLDVARRRPLLDTATVRRGKRRGEAYANLRPETRARLDLVGRERALIYKTMVLSGLRKKELSSLTVGQLHLTGSTTFAELEAADEKNREGSCIAIRADLAEDLRQWLADKLTWLQDEARRRGEPVPLRLPADTAVFKVPKGLLRILNRDLKLAGIPKRDDRGRTLDVHALRHTFGSLLSKGGVAPRTAHTKLP
jgi:integrase